MGKAKDNYYDVTRSRFAIVHLAEKYIKELEAENKEFEAEKKELLEALIFLYKLVKENGSSMPKISSILEKATGKPIEEVLKND